MAHSKQAKKRIRSNEKQRLHNKAITSNMRSEMKRVLTAVAAGDKAGAEAALPTAMRKIDKAAKSNVVHDNNAARKKSMLMRAIGRMG
ncbi:MAG: 30S ribosomal protein S20 [Planctomycetota bacterium]|jgi:small subunit ribosomal protein S20